MYNPLEKPLGNNLPWQSIPVSPQQPATSGLPEQDQNERANDHSVSDSISKQMLPRKPSPCGSLSEPSSGTFP